MKVGVLALQGAFEAHHQAFTKLGASTLLLKKASEVAAVSALALPGGESTTMLKLLDPELRDALIHSIKAGTPVLATCAGVILLATEVQSPTQDSLKLLDVTVVRNGYGRQVDSFIAERMTWTTAGKELLKEKADSLEGVFIRAPRITHTGKEVKTLIEHNGEPVLVKQDNILGATFHPELSSSTVIHELLLSLAR